MRYRRIWFVMLGIIAVGVLVTTCNSLMLNRRAAQSTSREAAMDQAAATEAGAGQSLEGDGNQVRGADESRLSEETRAEGQPGEGTPETMAAAAMDEALEEAAGPEMENSQVLSPLETTAPVLFAEKEVDAAKPAEGPGAVGPGVEMERNSSLVMEDSGITDYRARLDELDLQIQKMRSAETEATTYSMKTAAENELKLWDSELNSIYNDILTHLDEEQTKELVAAEREWMKTRDAKAVEAARKSAGGTLEGLEYTASLAESTRLRAYELADMYQRVAR